MSYTSEDKERIAINIIAKELETHPEIHAQVLIDMGLSEEYQAIGTMLRVGAMQANFRFNELYDKCLRKYSVDEYHDRLYKLNDGGLG